MKERPRTFAAYIGTTAVRHASEDFALMRGRYTDIVFPFTQENAKYDVDSFAALVAEAQRNRLIPWISPWGGRHFGGEGADTGMPAGQWIQAALATGAMGVHFDEPKVPLPILLTLLKACSGWQRMVSLEPERVIDMASLLTHVDLIATEAYEPTPGVGLGVAQRLNALRPGKVVCWVQGFRLPRGREHVPGVVATSVIASGLIPGVWPWGGGTGKGVLLSEDPGLVQVTVDKAIDKARRA